MSEQAAGNTFLSAINIPKLLAGALAAVSVAVLGSFLGVAGTLIGAALASVVGSLGTELYERSLKRGAAKLQQTLAPTFVKAPAAVGTPSVAAATDEDSPSHTVPATPARKLRWGRIAVLAGAVFVLSMGGIWVAEKALGEPLHNAVTGTAGTGTSLGGGSGSSSPKPTTPPTATVAPSESADPTATPSSTPSSVAPSASEPASVAPSSVAPTTAAPLQSADPGTGGGGAVPDETSSPTQ